MIVCVSANPAVDRRVWLTGLHVGRVNRALRARPAAGGKAAHVAMAARALGAEVLWVGFLGGAAGEACARGLAEVGVSAEVVRTRSETRVNLELIEGDGAVTEVLEPGGEIAEDELSEMLSLCGRIFERHGAGAQVVLSGSLAPGLPPNFYARLLEAAHASGCYASLDTSGAALSAALSSFPDLIKPNREEAEAVLGFAVRDEPSALAAARGFVERGARAVALSLGRDGLLWLPSANATPLVFRPPVMTGRSAVGCGDATIAGFSVAGLRGLGESERASLGVACGTANCSAESPGMIDPEEVARLLPLIEMRAIGDTGEGAGERR
jgi:1-phosphofructokinase family hexose kinase